MLLRTLLLFLCVSLGLCATLSLMHMQAKDEDTQDPTAVLDTQDPTPVLDTQDPTPVLDTQDPTPVLDNVVEAVEENIQETEATADEKNNDASPPEEENGLLEKLMENDKQIEVDIEVPEDVNAAIEDKHTEVDKDVPEEVNAIIEDKHIEVDKEVPEVTAATENVVPTQEVVTDSDKIEGMVEANVVDAPIQDPLPQEEDNEIKAIQAEEVPKMPEEQSSRWSFNSIRSSFQNMNGYFDSLVELVGGRNGVCEYRCRYGKVPAPRPGYQLPEPNGCSSSLVGFQLDLGIPAMTQCCNQLDTCYDTCGTSKYDCDSSFRTCLHGICSDLKKSLGLGTQYQTCESMADGLFNTVWTLGCRPYMNSQRAACICEEEEKDEL
ncbi:group XIIB secretory phospholipase A2-like protein isoform X2 [Boleophthalmus pectinirostris]|uniref:group XIIB secretory phospholipase A2-like protein isoform X2 n=1 Tax=Boleophthalmus pectinirostris TaxID=150288 RepID=UPI0024321E86|nr:group XIIB secretory phospholipase A2-like protein isoform X2 [Boleophthalmus pectinirostris]